MVDSIALCFDILFVCPFYLYLSVFTLQVPMLHPPSPVLCMWYSDTLNPLDSQLPVLQFVHLGISPVSSITRWSSLIYLQPCLHTAYGFVQTSCRCYLLQVPSLTAINSNCNTFSNFWPVFFTSLGKELIALSLPIFQASNLDHFSICNQPVIFILQDFMSFNKTMAGRLIPHHSCTSS